MQNRKAFILVTLLVVSISISGCSGNSRQALSGSVTLDGKPISGSISFDPIAGTTGPSTGGAIRDGNFSMPKSIGLLPGKYAVSIHATRKTGKTVSDGGLQVAQLLPIRFREENSLEATIVSGAENKFEYKLTSIPERQN